MLYQSWRALAAARSGEMALHDLASGGLWTFGQLEEEAERMAPCSASLICPSGRGSEFILQVLRGWRDRALVCPMEEGGEPPKLPASGTELPAEIVHLKVTSATTGPKRLICFTAPQLAADARNIVQTMGLRSEWPNLAVISLAHSYGFSNLVLPLLLHGIPLILLDSPLPSRLEAVARKFDNLTLPAVPALWRTWLESSVIPKSIRLAISAGAPLPLALETEIFQSTGLKVHNFYGSSECGGIAFDRTPVPRSEESLVGSVLEGVQLSVQGEGCLQVRGEAVGWGYWPSQPDVLGGGTFQTADLVALRGSEVLLLGRRSDQINIAGRKLSPETIESALRRHPQVSDCLVFGIPAQDAVRTETVVACVQSTGVLTRELLREFLQTQLADWQVPREWWFVEEIGTSERGKRSRPEWREKYLASKGKF